MPTTSKDEIILGSGHAYVVEASNSVTLAGDATVATINTFVNTYATSANLIGHIKGGATLTYSYTTYIEKDDFAEIQKTKTTDETVQLSFGLIDYKTGLLDKLIATASTEDGSNGEELTRIGGIDNDNGKSYYVIFVHEDAADSDVICIVKGKNIAELSAAFTNDAGTNFATQWQGESFDTTTGRKAFILRKDHEEEGE